jgi:hypothetical protein
LEKENPNGWFEIVSHNITTWERVSFLAVGKGQKTQRREELNKCRVRNTAIEWCHVGDSSEGYFLGPLFLFSL